MYRYELFLILTAEHTDPIIKRTDVDLIKAISRAQWRVGKAWFAKVLTRAPQMIGRFSTKKCTDSNPKVSGISSKLSKEFTNFPCVYKLLTGVLYNTSPA